jgi:P27 family predicted phage terminase small subunit
MPRRPTNKAATELKGNPRNLPVVKDHPKTGKAKPDPPTWLDATGKAYWRRVVPVLVEAGLFQAGDEESLAIMCQAYSDYRDCLDKLHAEGKVVETATGTIKANPLVAMAKTYADTHTRLSGEFGLTPAARSKMTLDPVEEADPLDAFIERKKTA